MASVPVDEPTSALRDSARRDYSIIVSLFLFVGIGVMSFVVFGVPKERRQSLYGRTGFDVVPVLLIFMPILSLLLYASRNWRSRLNPSGYLLLFSIMAYGALALIDAFVVNPTATKRREKIMYAVAFPSYFLVAYTLWWRARTSSLRSLLGPLDPKRDNDDKRSDNDDKRQTPKPVKLPIEMEVEGVLQSSIAEIGTEATRLKPIVDALTSVEKELHKLRKDTSKEARTKWVRVLNLKMNLDRRLSDALRSMDYFGVTLSDARRKYAKEAIKLAGKEVQAYYAKTSKTRKQGKKQAQAQAQAKRGDGNGMRAWRQ